MANIPAIHKCKNSQHTKSMAWKNKKAKILVRSQIQEQQMNIIHM